MCTKHGRSATAWRWLGVCFWQSIDVWGPILSIRIFSNYLHLPIFLLALADWVVLILAVYAANALLPHFDPAATFWRPALIFSTLSFIALLSLGLYRSNQRFLYVGSVMRAFSGILIGGAAAAQNKTDRFGDPLPPGAVARIGTVRFKHAKAVNSVAFLSDGNRIVSSSDDGTVRLWNAQSGALLHTFEGHRGKVAAVAVSPNGRLAASAGWDRTVRLWDLETLAPAGVLEGHKNNVNAVAFSPDGTRLLSGSYDSTLKLWRLPDGKMLRTLTGHEFGVNSLTFTPDGRRAVSASVDETVRIWDLENGEETASLVGHEGPVFGVAVSGDGRLAASGGVDHTVMLWDLQTATFIRAFYGHQRPVWSLAFTPDGERLLSAGSDEVVRVWDLETGTEIGGSGRTQDRILAAGVSLEAVAEDPRGAELFRKCAACHTVTANGAKRAGPTLYGLFGRPAGAVGDYKYSEALRGTGLVWTEQTVDALFAEGPHSFTPGSKMPLQQMPSAEDRANLIAFLKRITAPRNE